MSTLARVHSACARGIDGQPTEVEVHVRGTEPRLDIVGLPDTAGREARERIRSAILNSGYVFPKGRVTVNLAPAGTPKRGAGHDLAIALAVLAAMGVVPPRIAGRALLFGELALDGRVRPVRGAFLLATTAAPRELREILAPSANAREAALATDVPVVAVETLPDAVLHLSGIRRLARVVPEEAGEASERAAARDFAEVRGQAAAKRALVVAAAGAHNVLMTGPPGCGKTLLAERFADLLPPLSRDEALEVARLRSAAGLVVHGLPTGRPFRAPSCGASAAGVLGGGNPPRPGEISLAHRGVLFLDEAPHFRGDVLEGLRGPLEDGRLTISRAGATMTVPARFVLLAAMNPCACPHGGSPRCTCTPLAKERYTRRLSGPVVDRIDLRIAVHAVEFDDLRGGARGADTATLRRQVAAARRIQHERLGPGRTNATLSPSETDDWCRPDAAGERALRAATTSGKLTARGVGRVLRVARTLADLAGRAEPELTHTELQTALGWRVAL